MKLPDAVERNLPVSQDPKDWTLKQKFAAIYACLSQPKVMGVFRERELTRNQQQPGNRKEP